MRLQLAVLAYNLGSLWAAAGAANPDQELAADELASPADEDQRQAWPVGQNGNSGQEESTSLSNYVITQLDTIEPVPCPCGLASRAFGGNEVASLHLVEISVNSIVHYHKKMTEIYLVLEGDGHVELDGAVFPVKPMTAIMIKPGCRHRAVGKLRVVNIPIPAFDPADEWFDDEDAAGHRS